MAAGPVERDGRRDARAHLGPGGVEAQVARELDGEPRRAHAGWADDQEAVGRGDRRRGPAYLVLAADERPGDRRWWSELLPGPIG